MATTPPVLESDDGKPRLNSNQTPAPVTFESPLPWDAGEDQIYAWRKHELDTKVRRSVVKTLDDLKKMFGEDGSTIGLIITHGFESVERLQRFVDRRQPKLTEPPSRDGKNLCYRKGEPRVPAEQPDKNRPLGKMQDWMTSRWPLPRGEASWKPTPEERHGPQKAPLKGVYDFYVRWLTFLHYDTIVKLNHVGDSKREALATMNLRRLNEFYNGLALVPSELLEAEKRELGLDQEEAFLQPEKGFEWVWDFSRSLPDALFSVLAARRWSAQRHESLRDGEKQAWECVPPMTRLILILLAKEYEFEYLMTCSHVEDVSYDKRVIIISPKESMQCGREGMINLTKDLGPSLRDAIAKAQRELREVYDFRLLRDWGYGRPWKKLYVLIDTVADQKITERLGYRSLGDCVKEFRAHLHSSRKAYDLFDFHPLDLADHDKEESCTICLSEFESNGCIMELRCSHRFHPTCIMEYWDSEHRYDYLCPNCRNPGPTLSDRVQFKAEKKDNDIPDSDRETLNRILRAEIRSARRRGMPHSRLPRPYRLFLLQEELAKINAQRRADEAKDNERAFPLAY
ncbi:hypothetical protein FQN54_006790 [Arachnomyces sp. PD_36]|nr:hypothetical protein FQN54_006790 [Arachnomyces sp. PD_36]